MSTDQFKILDTQRKIDKNIRVMNILRFVPVFFMPMPIISVFASRLIGTVPEQKNSQWGMSLILIVLAFVISVFLIKKNKEYKMDLYYLEKENDLNYFDYKFAHYGFNTTEMKKQFYSQIYF